MLDVILLLGLALAIDSFAVSLSIGTANLSRPRYLGLSLGFCICDGLASLLGAQLGFGSGLHSNPWLPWIGPMAIAAYAFYGLLLARVTRPAAGITTAPWLVFGLPLCLSLDNFLTGGYLNALEVPAPVTAALFGLCSGLLAFVGLRLGGWWAARCPLPARKAGLLGLLMLALVSALI